MDPQYVMYKDTTFESGELSAGFLFETDIIETSDGNYSTYGWNRSSF